VCEREREMRDESEERERGWRVKEERWESDHERSERNNCNILTDQVYLKIATVVPINSAVSPPD